MEKNVPKNLDFEEFYYLWVAHLKDGTTIHQFDEDGNERSTHTSYKPEDLEYLALLPQKKNLSPVIVKAEKGKIPIYFRTKIFAMGLQGGKHERLKSYIAYGRLIIKQVEDKTIKVKEYTYIDPNTGLHYVSDDV